MQLQGYLDILSFSGMSRSYWMVKLAEWMVKESK